jgi:hypothetical protein
MASSVTKTPSSAFGSGNPCRSDIEFAIILFYDRQID